MQAVGSGASSSQGSFDFSPDEIIRFIFRYSQQDYLICDQSNYIKKKVKILLFNLQTFTLSVKSPNYAMFPV